VTPATWTSFEKLESMRSAIDFTPGTSPMMLLKLVLPTFFFSRRPEPRARRVHRLVLAELAEGVLDGVAPRPSGANLPFARS